MEQKKITFEEWLSLKQLSPRTIKEYKTIHKNFTQHNQLNHLTHTTINQYLKQHNNGVTRAYLKNLIQWLKNTNINQETKQQLLTYEMPRITGHTKRKLPHIITKQQILQIAKKSPNNREKLMILTQFYGGLRVSELTKIKCYDYNWEQWLKNKGIGQLKITGKGNKDRIVFIPEYIMRRTYNYILKELPQRYKKNTQQPIFQIGIRRYSHLLSKISKQAINREINTHLIRHSSATYLLKKGLSLMELKEYLGQEDIKTTQIYIHVNNKELRNKIKNIF